MADVRLLEGPFKQAQDIGVRYLLSLEPDRFLAHFLQEAGLPPKATHYGGWEAEGISGHSCGHYLSACALGFAATGDERLRERLTYMVDELARCQAANGNGYVAGLPNGKRIFAEIQAGNIRSAGFDLNGSWVPNYTLHKQMAGLRDAYRLAGLTNALTVERRLADWLESIYAPLNEEQMQKVLACEHGGMNEVLADLYADTADSRYLALSRRFHHRAILDPLARGEDILPGKHANTQIPKLIGLASRYELTGDSADRAAAEFFWERVVRHHSYVTGGHCNHEYFGPADILNDRLSPETTETCNVYNMLKLSEHVFGWTTDPRVADFAERALINHLRGSQHPDGRVVYNLSLQPGHRKEYQSLTEDFTCCIGTGMENHVRYGAAVAFVTDTQLFLNQFIAAELHWKERQVTLRVETQFPLEDTIRLRIATPRPTEWTLALRRPHWATRAPRLLVNDEVLALESTPSSYVLLHRTWKDGDRVEWQLPMDLRTESMPDNPHRLAVFFGPTVLAANLGPVEDPPAVDPRALPALVTDQRPVSEWVRSVEGRPGHFRTTGAGRPEEIDLEPFWSLHDRRYTVYLDEYDAAQWRTEESRRLADQERERKLEQSTIDRVRLGEMQPERDHQFAGEHTEPVESQGRKGRQATEEGWFSCRLRARDAGPCALVVTYRDGDRRFRKFDVLVDDHVIATREFARDQPERFFEEHYVVPPEVLRGKESVVVKFRAVGRAWTGAVYDLRLIRADSVGTP